VSDIATPAPSRRDEQKRRTTIALRESALQLFATRGFDATTTEDIAERAGVAVRTFFRYFPTKESVLHAGETTWVRAVADQYLASPAEVSDLEALRDGLVSAAPRLAAARETLFLYKRAVATSPVLQGREQDGQRDDAALIAGAVAERHGLARPDERCGLLADVVMVMYRRALATWLEGSASADLADGIRREFDLLATLVADR
jgi:AcrR family transcriptional regulator